MLTPCKHMLPRLPGLSTLADRSSEVHCTGYGALPTQEKLTAWAQARGLEVVFRHDAPFHGEMPGAVSLAFDDCGRCVHLRRHGNAFGVLARPL